MPGVSCASQQDISNCRQPGARSQSSRLPLATPVLPFPPSEACRQKAPCEFTGKCRRGLCCRKAPFLFVDFAKVTLATLFAKSRSSRRGGRGQWRGLGALHQSATMSSLAQKRRSLMTGQIPSNYVPGFPPPALSRRPRFRFESRPTCRAAVSASSAIRAAARTAAWAAYRVTM